MSCVSCLLLGIVSLGLAACSDAGDGSGAKAGGALRACLELPEQLPRPPAGRLPCELIPPGLSLE
ncbi:MAG TPA: hypothetical protein VER04_04300 [Polyangiaceae bacterium]|nr:hypothetical protein [Polyangiaceae bacterium]